MVDLVGIDGRKCSVGRWAGCRSPFAESTLTALGLSRPEGVCTNLKMKNQSWKTLNKPRHTQNTPRNQQQPGDRDHLEAACDEIRPTRLAHTRPLP